MLFVLAGLGVLALVSTVFGMMMAVSQDLPAIYNFAQFRAAQNTVVVDDTGEPIGTLSSNQNKILLDSFEISQNVKNATVAIEDSRFYQHARRRLSRASPERWSRTSSRAAPSRAPRRSPSNSSRTRSRRRAAARSSRSSAKPPSPTGSSSTGSKDKILTEYLNTIYFGEGAYGIEAAARTYFGWNHPDCGTRSEPCASVLLPQEAAMLAGIIASPSAYDPKLHPLAAKERRDLVLQRMYEQGYITEEQYNDGVALGGPLVVRHRAARDRLRGALLHDLAAPAAGRQVRARQGLLRRAEGEDAPSTSRSRKPPRRPSTTAPRRSGSPPRWS